MKTILLTAIGGDIAQGIASVIRENEGEYRLIGVDLHEEHGGTLFVDAFHTVLPATDMGYVASLMSVVDKEQVDIVVPVSEPELAVWADAEVERSSSVKWLMLDRHVVNAGLDKLETNRALRKMGLDGPWTVPVVEQKSVEFPCILKDRIGSGSRNVFRISSQEDLDYLAPRHPDGICQELLSPHDQEVTCAVYRTRDDRIATLQLKRRLTGGLTGYAEIINDNRVAELCTVLAEGFDLHGSINVQLIITEKGPMVFEINPRFSSTALMRHRLGFTDVVWSLAELSGEDVCFPSSYSGRIAVRTHDAVIVG